MSDSRHAMANLLFDAGCIAARADEPFRLPSGWASPVYMDCRRLISFPAIRRAIVLQSLTDLRIAGALEGLHSIVGAESSGIAMAAWLAEKLDLPLLYVRKKPVGHKHIEGVLEPGSRVLLVDDMMAAGQSKMRFLRSLIEAGAVVSDLFVVFSYGTFSAEAALAAHGVRVNALAQWSDVLEVAKTRQIFTRAALDELESFLENPVHWSQKHGGIGAAPTFS